MSAQFQRWLQFERLSKDLYQEESCSLSVNRVIFMFCPSTCDTINLNRTCQSKVRAQHHPPTSPCSPGSQPNPRLQPRRVTSRLRGVILPLCSAVRDPSWSTVSISGAPKVGRTCWRGPRGGHKDTPRAGAPLFQRQAGRAFQPKTFYDDPMIPVNTFGHLLGKKFQTLWGFFALNATKYHYSQRQPKRKTDQNTE